MLVANTITGAAVLFDRRLLAVLAAAGVPGHARVPVPSTMRGWPWRRSRRAASPTSTARCTTTSSTPAPCSAMSPTAPIRNGDRLEASGPLDLRLRMRCDRACSADALARRLLLHGYLGRAGSGAGVAAQMRRLAGVRVRQAHGGRSSGSWPATTRRRRSRGWLLRARCATCSAAPRRSGSELRRELGAGGSAWEAGRRQRLLARLRHPSCPTVRSTPAIRHRMTPSSQKRLLPLARAASDGAAGE